MDRPNIVLMLVDDVGALHCSLYGYERATTPGLERVAERAVVFDRAVTPAVWTLPSVTSLFTGVYPSDHRMVRHGQVLEGRFRTLAQALRERGYRTLGLCHDVPYFAGTGMDRGFDDFRWKPPDPLRVRIYRRIQGLLGRRRRMPPAGPKADPPGPGRADEAEEPWLGFETRPVNTPLVEWIRYHASALMDKGSRRVLRMATDLLARRDPGRPFFLYLHTGEAHMPYLPPWRYRRRFRPAGTRGVRGWRINQYPLPYALGERPISEPQFRVLRALYDGAVAYQDRLIGEAFEGLRRLGLAGNTVFVLLSDHGEMLGEKGILGHHWCAYEPLVRVPLVVSFPGGEARRERRIVQSLDVPRTLVELAGGDEAFRAQQQGNSLLEPGAGPRPADFAVTEHLKPLSRDRLHLRDRLADRYHGVIGFRSAAHKYVWRTTGEEEFYCLETDPEEERNRIDDEAMAREVGRLRGRAAPWLDRFRQAYAAVQAALTREKAPDVSDEVEQRLRELGYVD